MALNLTKKQIILYAIGLAMVWGTIITLFADQIQAMPYYFQFVLAAGAGYLFPSIIIGHAFETKINKRIIGAWFFILATDLLLPPLAVNLNGEFVSTGLFSLATPDKLLFELYKQTNISGAGLFILCYPISFIIFISIAVYLLTDKQILKLANGGY